MSTSLFKITLTLLVACSSIHQTACVKYQRVQSPRARRVAQALFLAVAQGNAQATQKALGRRDANPNALDEQNNTLLHVAVALGHTQVAQALITHGAQLEVRDNDGETPLSLALLEKRFDVAELLLANGALINSSCPDGSTMLHRACKQDDEEIVKLLLTHNADIHARDLSRRTPLHVACRHGKTEAAHQLIKAGSSLAVHDEQGWNALHWALYNGHYELVCDLMQDNTTRTKQECLQNIRASLVAQIAKNHQNYTKEQIAQWLALYLACRNGQTFTAEMLIKNGAGITTSIMLCSTALHAACRGGHLEVVQLLLSQKNVCVSRKMIEWARRLPVTTLHSNRIIELLEQQYERQMYPVLTGPIKSILRQPRTKNTVQKSVQFRNPETY